VADEEHPVFVAAVGEQFGERGRIGRGADRRAVLGEFFDRFAATEIDAQQVLSDAVDPYADGGVVLQLRAALPPPAPGGLGDFLSQFVLYAAGL
jgi:hypothetical protein